MYVGTPQWTLHRRTTRTDTRWFIRHQSGDGDLPQLNRSRLMGAIGKRGVELAIPFAIFEEVANFHPSL